MISLAVMEGVVRALLLFVPRGGEQRAGDASQDAKEVVRLKLGRHCRGDLGRHRCDTLVRFAQG